MNNTFKEIENVKITDDFWIEKLELVKNKVIPYQWNALNDKIVGAEKSFCVRNFKLAKAVIEKRNNNQKITVFPTDKWEYKENECDDNSFLGWVFQDSDLYKWIESTSYILQYKKDEELEKLVDYSVDLICSASEKDGYINTHYSINDISKRFTNLKDKHELYCFGHLAESAVAYFTATKKNKLLKQTLKFADLICNTFNEHNLKGYPGHEIAEMALIKLYKITNDEKYLNTAKFFIDMRGCEPNYFSLESGKNYSKKDLMYNQAHIPVREQKDAVGHAVRGVYLYSGMADVAKLTNDKELFTSCKNIWKNIVDKKMYITGGIGANVDGESFSFDYDLPNDSAYAESCAAIGLVFFAKRMFDIDNNSSYADVMEKAIYNGILSGISQSGDKFFYVNPLEVDPKASELDSRKSHIKPERQKWFTCACCPPNIARLISSISSYIYTENKNDFFLHLYISSIINSDKAKLIINSTVNDNGKLKIKINHKKDFTLAIRIPQWADNFTFSEKNPFIKNGYAYFNITDNCEIEAQFEIRTKIIMANENVKEDIGKVAVTRGATVFCLEEVDNGKNLHLLRLNKTPHFKYENGCIFAKGIKESYNQNTLYGEYKKPKETMVDLKFVPYRIWSNREVGEMQVYIRI